MGVATAIAVGGALLGAYAGSQQSHSSTSGSNSSGIDLTGPSGTENDSTKGIATDYSALRTMVGQGPGAGDVSRALQQQRDLATMQGDYARTGGAASQQDILQAQENAKLQFAPQQVALDQSFKDEQTRASQMAAQLGRPINDPYIQAQLGKERMNSIQMLAANQGAYVNQASQQGALNRLGFTQQLTDTRNSLASQAMANRQALLSIGQGIQSNERNFRLATGTKWGTSQSDTTSGGGTKGAIEGGIAGAGMGMSAGKMFTMGAPQQSNFTSGGGSESAGTYGPSASMMTAQSSSFMQPDRSNRLQANYNPMNGGNFNQSGYDTGFQGIQGWAGSMVNNFRNTEMG